ncbi:MAG TPA: cell division protein ZapB [Vicinamibacterales bacterium]|nr:cell division protein ZapB [Vicinamibacterales bacterium]
MAKTMARGVDLEPIDRLEEKVKLLVAMMGRMRDEQARVTEENLRLAREIEALRARMADTDGVRAELSSMREERDLVRNRVAEMLEQLEGLNL